jgi:hypothetical protein
VTNFGREKLLIKGRSAHFRFSSLSLSFSLSFSLMCFFFLKKGLYIDFQHYSTRWEVQRCTRYKNRNIFFFGGYFSGWVSFVRGTRKEKKYIDIHNTHA